MVLTHGQWWSILRTAGEKGSGLAEDSLICLENHPQLTANSADAAVMTSIRLHMLTLLAVPHCSCYCPVDHRKFPGECLEDPLLSLFTLRPVQLLHFAGRDAELEQQEEGYLITWPSGQMSHWGAYLWRNCSNGREDGLVVGPEEHREEQVEEYQQDHPLRDRRHADCKDKRVVSWGGLKGCGFGTHRNTIGQHRQSMTRRLQPR